MTTLAAWVVPIAFVATVLVGAPIAVAIGIAATLGMVILGEQLGLLGTIIATSMQSEGLIAIPFYVMAGLLLAHTGIAHALLTVMLSLLWRIRGAPVIITGVASVMFGGMSGSGPADVAAISLIFLPTMEKRGYPRAFGAALTAAGGTLGLIIPPSAGLILYALITERASIPHLFLAGIIPGILVATGFVVSGLIASRKFDLTTDIKGVSRAEFRSALLPALLGLVAPVVILGGIYTGTTTVTESAAIAVVYALIVGLSLKTLTFGDILATARQTGVATGIILFVVAASSIFAWVVSVTGWARAFSGALAALAGSPVQFMLLTAAIFLVAGMFLDGISMYFILVPLLLPGVDLFAIDPIYFGIVVTVTIAIGLITPPVGLDLFAAASVIDVRFESMARAAVPLVLGAMAALLVIILFPSLSLVLVR